MKRCTTVYALALFCASIVCAQQSPLQLSFQHLTQEQGLTNSINSHVFKDSRGLVWISSIDGLNRFDGSSIKAYRPDPSREDGLAGNIISSPFFEDRKGNLWFTTMGHCNVIIDHQISFQQSHCRTEVVSSSMQTFTHLLLIVVSKCFGFARGWVREAFCIKLM